MKNIGTAIARAAALAVSSSLTEKLDWKVRFSANCIYGQVLKAQTADRPSEFMTAAARHADRIISGVGLV